jgi:GMP synthase-like glutamine amidotransferase
LPAARALLRSAVERETPTLALCLGAQLLAAATGGKVVRGADGPELGRCTVSIAPTVADDPLFEGLSGDVDVVQWHWDAITSLPPGATALASSPKYDNQAFRLGARAWGLLFHPEVTLPLVAQWAQDDRDAVLAAGFEPTELVGAVAEAERRLLEQWTPLLERFAALATGGQ